MVRLAAPRPVIVTASWIPISPEDRAMVPATWKSIVSGPGSAFVWVMA
jgi:hypothetical protein